MYSNYRNFTDSTLPICQSILGAHYKWDYSPSKGEWCYEVSLEKGDKLDLKKKKGYWGSGRNKNKEIDFIQEEMKEGDTISLFHNYRSDKYYAIRTGGSAKIGREYCFDEDQSGQRLGYWTCLAQVKMADMDQLLELTHGQEKIYLGCFK